MNKKLRRWRKRIVIARFVCDDIRSYGAVAFPIGLAANAMPYMRNSRYTLFRMRLPADVLAQSCAISKTASYSMRILMAATIGAFSLVFFPDFRPLMAEGAAVMLFYQVCELFNNMWVGLKAVKSIGDDGHCLRFREHSKHERRFGAGRPRQRCCVGRLL